MSRHHRELNARKWKRCARLVRQRDSYRCRACGRACGRGEVDHVQPLSVNAEQDPYRLDGLQLLCKGCHRAKTAGENRRQPTAGKRRGDG